MFPVSCSLFIFMFSCRVIPVSSSCLLFLFYPYVSYFRFNCSCKCKKKIPMGKKVKEKSIANIKLVVVLRVCSWHLRCCMLPDVYHSSLPSRLQTCQLRLHRPILQIQYPHQKQHATCLGCLSP